MEAITVKRDWVGLNKNLLDRLCAGLSQGYDSYDFSSFLKQENMIMA